MPQVTAQAWVGVPPATAFAVSQTTGELRLRWDPFIRHQHLIDADHGTWSSVGERFAGLVQREIIARTDVVDLRWHPKTWDLLRMTRMPAIRLDPGYLSNAGDSARLRDPAFRDLVAEAIVVAVQRFYLSPEIDSPTGVLDFSQLRDSFQGS